jgi:hypothetical protein
MKPQSAKAKGRVFEKQVAAWLRSWFPAADRDGRSRAVDVLGTPWWVECKFQERLNIRAAVDQAVAARDYKNDDRPIIVVHKKSREEWLITMRVIDFERIAGLTRPELPESLKDD